jgi:hypothetical protein
LRLVSFTYVAERDIDRTQVAEAEAMARSVRFPCDLRH